MPSTSADTLVPCHLVATSPFVHVPGRDFRVDSSQASAAEADVLLRVLLRYGERWLHDNYSIRILAAYSGQVLLIKQALRLIAERATDCGRKALAGRLLELPIQTADATQGAESDIVLASLVRATGLPG